MKKRIQFSLVYRDMWQSSGKFQPRKDQLERIAPAIIDMGVFDRVETNGGAFEQVNLMYGENPNKSVRAWTKEFNKAGIQTHMLERALNGLRMYGVPKDVRQLMPKVKKAQGVDIMRSFCGLNDHRNLELSIKYAKEAGMISQAALSITYSPIHTVDYYMGIVDKVVEYGADEIALKDMAGIGRPTMLGKLVYEIKKKYPHIIVQYHGHTGPGFAMASVLEVARAGADVIDTAISPFSGGTSQPATETLYVALTELGYEVDLDEKVLYEIADYFKPIRAEYIADGTLNPISLTTDTQCLNYQIPGGMLSNLLSQLEMLGQIDKFDEALAETPRVRADLGYPPLVTPTSQLVGTQAVQNVLAGERYKNVGQEIRAYCRGEYGRTPAPINEEIRAQILGDEKPIEGRYADTLPKDAFEKAEAELGDRATCEEDVLSYIAFPPVAEKFFDERKALEERKVAYSITKVEE